MSKLFEYPSGGWNDAGSKHSADSLSFVFWELLKYAGLYAYRQEASNPNVVGWNSYVKVDGGVIEFKDQRVGCKIEVVITDPMKFEENIAFRVLWKNFVDEAVIFGGPYSPDLSSEKETSGVDESNSEIPSLEELENYCYKWVNRGDRREEFSQWCERNRAPIWFTKTLMYDHLKIMLKSGKVEKRGREYHWKKK